MRIRTINDKPFVNSVYSAKIDARLRQDVFQLTVVEQASRLVLTNYVSVIRSDSLVQRQEFGD